MKRPVRSSLCARLKKRVRELTKENKDLKARALFWWNRAAGFK